MKAGTAKTNITIKAPGATSASPTQVRIVKTPVKANVPLSMPPPEALMRFKEAYLAELRTLRQADGIHQTLTAHLAVARKAE